MFKFRILITMLIFIVGQLLLDSTAYGKQYITNDNKLFFNFYADKLFERINNQFSAKDRKLSYYDQLVALQQTPNNISVKQKAALTHIEEPIRLTFAGDAMFDWSVKQTVKQKGADYPFEYIKTELASSDLRVVNLETSITTGGTKQGKQYTFRSDPIALSGLKNAGFQLVSLANNHSLDYGLQGFTDTVANLKQYQLDYVGGGLNKDEAYAAKSYSIKGKIVKILAFSKVLPDFSWVAAASKPGLANGYDISLINHTIQTEKEDADYLFVFIHWGIETKRSPEPFQREWAKLMIDAGADGVIGSHPHVLQGFEYYKDKPIAYSLGNFLFPNYIKGNAAQTGVLHLDIKNEKIGMTFVPYRIYNDQIVKQNDREKLTVWNELQRLSFGDLQIQEGMIKDSASVAEAGN
ncbi:CapA family protein [Paenibacillus sp. BSR1-1]|uniref:CapA family protein n=1 Tax=Paenibacillus sp. BSR1-1 TaxID=3020845 RepID=UPI0025B20A91|nr:CapA family protein [Paenibacillus sp. BSR1-1]MDN3015258.1 CapA family protein [Paenibacillus sp. BSR1-1]